MDNIYKLIILILFLNITTISALGVNAPYWNDNPLKMYSGETREVVFPLVNSIDEKTTEASVSLVEGKEIAEITSGEKYIVQPGSTDKNIILKITVPSDSKIDDSYKIKFFVRYTPQGEEGNVKLDVEYNIEFPIQIVSQGDESPLIITTTTGNEIPKESKMKIIVNAIILFVILLILVILIIIKFRKNKNQEYQTNKFK